MSEENKILGGTPVVDSDDAIEFFSQRAKNACPACGENKWTITRLVRSGDENVAPGLIGVKLSNGATISQGVPVVIVTCKKCAFLRTHDLVAISEWLAAGKPEYVDND